MHNGESIISLTQPCCIVIENQLIMNSVHSSYHKSIQEMQVLQAVWEGADVLEVHVVVGIGCIFLYVPVVGWNVHVDGGVKAWDQVVKESVLWTGFRRVKPIRVHKVQHAVFFIEGFPNVTPVICSETFPVFMKIYINNVLFAVFIVFTPLVIHSRSLCKVIYFILLLESFGKINFVAICVANHLFFILLFLL